MRTCVVVQPARHVEQTEPPLAKPIPSPDTYAPPFAIMMAGAEREQLFMVIVSPLCKSKIIVHGGDPLRARADLDELRAIRVNKYLGVRAIELFSYYTIA